MRNYSPVYNKKRFLSEYNSIDSEVVGFSWKDSRTKEEAFTDLGDKPLENRDRLIDKELRMAAKNHKYGLFGTIHEDGSLCEAMFVSGDGLWVQKNGEGKIML